LTRIMTTNEVSFVCNCGEEITLKVTAGDEYNVSCPKCGQEYRFTGASVLRFGSQSGP
jgi:redox-regulated HSP33 family molecular chaperone